jgi:hypothetical protein
MARRSTAGTGTALADGQVVILNETGVQGV